MRSCARHSDVVAAQMLAFLEGIKAGAVDAVYIDTEERTAEYSNGSYAVVLAHPAKWT